MAENQVAAKLSVEVEARLGKLEKGLKKAEAKAKVSGKKIEKAVNKSGGGLDGLTKGAMKGVAAMGILELAAGAVNVGFKLMSGDIEEAVAMLEMLPAGIGPFARQLKGLLGHITGIGDEIERLNQSSKLGERLIDFARDVMESRQATVLASKAIADAIEREVELLGKSKKEAMAILALRAKEKLASTFDQKIKELDIDKKQLKTKQELNKTISELEKKNKKGLSPGAKARGIVLGGSRMAVEIAKRDAERKSTQRDIDQAKKSVRRINEIDREVAEVTEARRRVELGLEKLQAADRVDLEKKTGGEIVAEKKKQADETKAIAERQAAEQDGLDQDRIAKADRLASIESQIRQEQLRATGETAKAAKEATAESFRAQIESAERAGDDILSAKLRLLRDLRLADERDEQIRKRGTTGQGSTRDVNVLSQEEAQTRRKRQRLSDLSAGIDRQNAAERVADFEASRGTMPTARGAGGRADSPRGDDIVEQLKRNNELMERLSLSIVGA